MGFLSSRCSGKVPQLASRGESSGFSPDAVVFLSSYNGPVRCEEPLGIPPQLLLGRWSSSGVEAGTSGFLFRTNMDLGVPLDAQGSQASSHVDTCTSALLSSWKSSVRLALRLTQGSVALSRGTTGLSHPPSCFELILGMTIESVAGESGVSGVHWNMGSFEMMT